jgi:hypothetical protein
VPAESVIITLGLQPDHRLSANLESSGIRTFSIGDCTGVGYIEGAIRDGLRAALALESDTT